MHLDRRLAGWGLTLILVGAIPLAVDDGLLGAATIGRWPQLWPLLVIAGGLSLVLSRTSAAWAGTLVAALVVGVMGGGLVATGLGELPSVAGCGGGSAQAFEPQAGTVPEGGRLDLEMSCGTLSEVSVPGSGWSLHGTDGDGRPPVVDSEGTAVTLHPADDPGLTLGRGKVAWTLDLPADPTLDLGVTLNAATGQLDLAGLKLASLDATLNAGNLDADLGARTLADGVSLTVNAGSAAISSAASAGTFDLSLNAGRLHVCLPAGAAVLVDWSGVLASNDLDAAGLEKVDDHTWTTPGLDRTRPHIELDVSANVGSFDLTLGGGCSAS